MTQLFAGFVVTPLATVLGWFLNNWSQKLASGRSLMLTSIGIRGGHPLCP